MFAANSTVTSLDLIFSIAWMASGFSALIALGFSALIFLSLFITTSRKTITEYWAKGVVAWIVGLVGLLSPFAINLSHNSLLGFRLPAVVLMLAGSGMLMLLSVTISARPRPLI